MATGGDVTFTTATTVLPFNAKLIDHMNSRKGDHIHTHRVAKLV